MEVFGQYGHASSDVFGVELRLTIRFYQSIRHIRYVFVAGETLASFWALSRNGRSSPRILVTIQSGPLEEPDGPMEALLAAMRPPRPTIWVRGRHQRRARGFAFAGDMDAERAIATPSTTYPVRLGRFAGWRSDVGADSPFFQPSDRDPANVAAFAFARSAPPPAMVWQVHSTTGERVVRLVPWTSSPDEKPPLYVGSNRSVQAAKKREWDCVT